MYLYQRGSHAPHQQQSYRHPGHSTRATAAPYHHVPQRAQLAPQGPHDVRPPHRSEPRRCYICSYTQPYPDAQIPIYHRHFSSLRLRELIGVEDMTKPYQCPSCKSHHQPYPNDRIKIVVSDSTLHQFFAPPGYTATLQYQGDVMHCDYISIPGATIDTLSQAFRLDYVEKIHSRPLDVVLVAGYNDIVIGRSRESIMDSFLRFTNVVKNAGSTLHQENNTVAVSDFMYAPQFSWFPDNGPLPSNHQGNQIEKLHWLNQAILALNLDNNITEFHRMHKYGLRDYTRKYVDQYGQEHQRKVKCHRWEHWREIDRASMLHLRNDRRFKMGAAINKYFILRT